MNDQQRPRIDSTMHVYCPIHSEQPGSNGHRRGQVPATFDYKAGSYDCWHCADLRWRNIQLSPRESESLAGEF